jgi:DegV family protein with EDD domain
MVHVFRLGGSSLTRIAIITDTDSSLPKDLASRWGIRQVPITIHFGEQVLETGTDINDADLFERIDRESVFPTTAAPAPGKFAEAFEEAFAKGAEQILCICLSSEVSAVFQSARTATNLFVGKDITVIDSRSLSLGHGFMALVAAEMASQGASKENILAALEDLRARTYLYASLATLKYLAMSGRVGQLTAGIAGLISIRPVLTIQQGKLEMLEKVRTQAASWARVMECAYARCDGKPMERAAILHVNALDAARQFEHLLREKVQCPQDLFYAELTPGLSGHTGPGLVGVAFVTKK